MNENEELPEDVTPEEVEETQEPEVDMVEETEPKEIKTIEEVKEAIAYEEGVYKATDVDPDVDEMQESPVRDTESIIENIEEVLNRMGTLQGVSKLKELIEELKASL